VGKSFRDAIRDRAASSSALSSETPQVSTCWPLTHPQCLLRRPLHRPPRCCLERRPVAPERLDGPVGPLQRTGEVLTTRQCRDARGREPSPGSAVPADRAAQVRRISGLDAADVGGTSAKRHESATVQFCLPDPSLTAREASGRIRPAPSRVQVRPSSRSSLWHRSCSLGRP